LTDCVAIKKNLKKLSSGKILVGGVKQPQLTEFYPYPVLNKKGKEKNPGKLFRIIQ
jgi:hypothetical protein